MLETGDTLRLPCGLDYNGGKFRTVVVDKMRGVDEENLTRKNIGNNGAKAVSMLLRRCIQKIPGLIESKSQFDLIDEGIVKAMAGPDRDYVLLCILAQGQESMVVDLTCPACGGELEEEIHFSRFKVYEWDDGPLEFPITLSEHFTTIKGQKLNEVIWQIPNGATMERAAALPKEKSGSALLAACARIKDGVLDVHDVQRMSSSVRAEIDRAAAANAPGVDTSVTITCGVCDHSWEAKVDPESFFKLAKGRQTPKTAPVGVASRRKER